VAAKFVLASASPRRRQLLAEAGFAFEVAKPIVPESESAALTLRELTICNAARKAIAVARSRPDAIVLGADTLVALGRNVIGKPRDLADARRLLRRLRGREHQVCTSVFICAVGGARVASFSVTSQVRFRPLTDDEIAAYLAKVDPLDKAGAYAAQDDRGELIDCVEGCFDNVIGLPMKSLAWALERLG